LNRNRNLENKEFSMFLKGSIEESKKLGQQIPKLAFECKSEVSERVISDPPVFFWPVKPRPKTTQFEN